MLGGHGGNIYEMARRLGCAPSEVIDMSSNINPLGPPPGLVNYSDNFRPNIGRRIKSIDSEDTVFICNPNNPTGSLIPKHELEWLCRSHPDTNFIVDESYLPFVNLGEKESMINSGLANVIVLISISKIFKNPARKPNAC